MLPSKVLNGCIGSWSLFSLVALQLFWQLVVELFSTTERYCLSEILHSCGFYAPAELNLVILVIFFVHLSYQV